MEHRVQRPGCGTIGGAENQTSGRATFWRKRLQQYAHTGWSDPVIYAYDQRERLAFVKRMVKKEAVTRGRALDFGCGTGDFSRLLLSLGFEVCGYDPYVRPAIHANGFTYAEGYDQIRVAPGSADLALSVTTLDHILDDNEARRALALISTCLKANGVLLMLEYALDCDADRLRLGLKNDYQSFRTLARWTELLRQNSLCVTGVTAVSHPQFCPSRGYSAYARSPLWRVRRRLVRWRQIVDLIDILLQWQAALLVSKSPSIGAPGNSSPLKLIRCTSG